MLIRIIFFIVLAANLQFAVASEGTIKVDKTEKASKNLTVLSISLSEIKMYMEILKASNSSNPAEQITKVIKKNSLTQKEATVKMAKLNKAYVWWTQNSSGRKSSVKVPGCDGLTPETKVLFKKYGPEITKFLMETAKAKHLKAPAPPKKSDRT
jgi:predicted transcriptional regulator